MFAFVRDPVGVIKDIVTGFQRVDGLGLAAEAAYRLIFAIPALTIFFTSLSSLVAEYTGVDVFQTLLQRAQSVLPYETYDLLQTVVQTVDEQSNFGVLSFGLLIALWSGSNAIVALVKAINRAHGLEDRRGIVEQRIVALALIVGLSLTMITSFVLFVFGEQLGRWLAGFLGYGEQFTSLVTYFRMPVALLLFMLALGVLYGFGAAQHMTVRTTLPGVIIATLLWLAASYGFSIYLDIADPGSAYGVLGGILVMLLFLYLSSIAIIVGAEVNATLLRRRTRIARRVQPPEPESTRYVEYG